MNKIDKDIFKLIESKLDEISYVNKPLEKEKIKKKLTIDL